jgi:transposase-like protein
MTEKEKEQKALEIYQQLMHALADIADKEGVIEIVNTLIDENGLSAPVDGKETVLSAKRGRSDDDEVSLCPRCGSSDVVKNGSAHGKSRFLCKGCGSYFGPTTGKVTEGSSRSSKKWDIFIEGMLSGDSLPILSEKCGIALSTAHNWRLKLFSQVSNSTEGRILRGVIQEDEFYLASSFKGNWKGALNLGIEKDYSEKVPDYVKYGFRSHPHKRGSEDSRRGLSRDKVCMATAIDDGRNVIGKPVGRGNVSSAGLAHFALDSKTESRKGRYNLQLVNALHSVISEISHSRSCFATKNAEAYITWEAWKLLNRTKSLEEKKDILKSLSTTGKRAVTVEEIRAKELPEILHQTITT